MKKAKRYKVFESGNEFVNWLQSSLVLALLSHWLFQSLLYMDQTERRFKLGLDVIMIGFYIAVAGSSWINFCLGFSLAHTLNFVFNGQINGVLKSFGISRADTAKLQAYLEAFTHRVQGEPSIIYAAAYGSLVRGELQATSDIDIRAIRRAGTYSGMRGCLFVLLERSRALFYGVPLDIYLLDNQEGLTRLRSDEAPHLIKG